MKTVSFQATQRISINKTIRKYARFCLHDILLLFMKDEGTDISLFV